MSFPYSWRNGEYPLDVGPDASTDARYDDFSGVEQAVNGGFACMSYQGHVPAYGTGQRDVQGYLDDNSHQPAPMTGEGDWQMQRYHSSQQSCSNYDPQLELDSRGPMSFHEPQPQEVEPSNRDSQPYPYEKSSYSNDPFKIVPTSGQDTGNGALNNPEMYREQSDNLGEELRYDWLTESNTPVNHVSRNYNDTVSVSVNQFEDKEEGPWSTETQHSENPSVPIAKLNWLARLAGASDSYERRNSSDTSNLVPSTSESAGDSEYPDWEESSMVTVRPPGPPPSSRPGRTSCAPNPTGYNGQQQGQSCFMPPTYPAFGPRSAQGSSTPGRNAVKGTSRRQSSNHDGSHLRIPTPKTSSPGSSSQASSAPPDPLHCPLCSAKFTGKHRRGNCGRHKRQKHRGQVTVVCEASNCGMIFQRNDARLKHYRRKHPELLPGSSSS